MPILQPSFSEDQVEYLRSLRFINRIDDRLMAVALVRVQECQDTYEPTVNLVLELFYDNERIDCLSFDLHHYNFDSIVELARNIRSSEFVLREIDHALAGDLAE